MFATALSFHNHRNLSIVQLATLYQDSFQYISSPKAIKENLIEVKEVNDAGTVNSLVVLNTSDFFVFMMDGEVLSGAKQNRVVNTSILLAPRSKAIIPVSCVEQGRWSRATGQFSGTQYTAPSFMRAAKARGVKQNLDRRQGHTADQGEVWAGVAMFQQATGVDSSTSNLSDVYDRKARELEEFLGHFTADPQANGVAVFIEHNLLCLDIFNRKDVYGEYFPKILRGVALEAFYMSKPDEPMYEAEAKFKTLDFLDGYEALDVSYHPGVGIGSERRFDSGGLAGFELSYRENMIHLTALRANPTRKRAA